MNGKGQTESTEPEGNRKPRGPAVPTVDLRKALELMRKIWDKEKRNAAPVPAILTHWGYRPKSSGGFLAIASLKRYGLLDEQGSNERRTLKLSAFALNLLKNETLNPAEYQKLLKQAALMPTFHREMWKKYGVEMPSDQTVGSHLVFERGFAPETATAFIKQYKDTISLAKLTENDTVQDSDTEAIEETDEASTAQSKRNSEPPPAEPKPPKSGTNMSSASNGTSVQPGELPVPIGGGLIARVPFPMTQQAYNILLETLKLWEKILVKTSSPIPPAIKLPADAMWRNNDSDKPVKIIALMGDKDGELYFQSSDGTGIPASELTFQK
jgi:hypothetical protein